MNTERTEDLHERIFRLLDGDLDAQELIALDSELRTNREARALYLQLACLHSSLECHHASRTDSSRSTIIPIDRFLARQRKRMVSYAALVAAVLLMVSAAGLWLRLAGKNHALASFQTTQGTQYALIHDAETDNLTGKILRPGSRLHLFSGTMEATFSSGVRCVIDAPCEITCHSEKLLSVADGVAWFHVPSAASGFTVHTGKLEIIDLGTEFGVIANRHGSDEIHVTQGSVEATARVAGKQAGKVLLKAGEARRIDTLGNLVHTAFNAARFSSSLLKPLTIRNADFETVLEVSPDDDERGYGPVQGWATSGAGVGLNKMSQPFLEQPAHSGSHVAFIQGKGLISQTVSGFDPSKLYTVTYFVSERGLSGAATRTSASLDLGSNFYIQADLIRKTDAFRRIVSGPLHVFGPTANIEIRAQTVTGDAALLIDSIRISRAVPTVPDGGFENPALPPSSFKQAIGNGSGTLTGSAWTFFEGGGINTNRSAFASPPVPEGSQAAVLQGRRAAFETTVTGFETGVTYSLSLEAATHTGGAAPFQVLLDDEILSFNGSHTLAPDSLSYQTFTSQDFTVSGATRKLRIAATGEGASFIDDIRFNFVAEPPE